MQHVEEEIAKSLRSNFKNRQVISIVALGLLTQQSYKALTKKPKLFQYYRYFELRDKVQEYLLENGLASPDVVINEIRKFCKQYDIDYTQYSLLQFTPTHILYRNLIKIACLSSTLYYKKHCTITNDNMLGTVAFIKSFPINRKYRAMSQQLKNRIKSLKEKLTQLVPEYSIRDAVLEEEEVSYHYHKIAKLTPRRVFIIGAFKEGHTTCLCCNKVKLLTCDHVIPQSLHSTSSIKEYKIDHKLNFQWLCNKCNSSKATDIVDYRNPSHVLSVIKLFNSELHKIITKSFRDEKKAAFIFLYRIFYKETTAAVQKRLSKYFTNISSGTISYYYKKLQELIHAHNLVLM